MIHENPKLKQSQIASQLGCSTSILQRKRNDIYMLSPYRIQSNNNNKRKKKTSNTTFNNKIHREFDIKRPQTTSNDPKTTQTNTKSYKKNKNILNLDPYRRILKLTINIQMKFWIIMIYKWF